MKISYLNLEKSLFQPENTFKKQAPKHRILPQIPKNALTKVYKYKKSRFSKILKKNSKKSLKFHKNEPKFRKNREKFNYFQIYFLFLKKNSIQKELF